MDKLTTAYVRESLARVPYEDALDPMTLKEMKERLLVVYVNDCRVKILDILCLDNGAAPVYHVHITRIAGLVSAYEEDKVISRLVRKINRICLGGRCIK